MKKRFLFLALATFLFTTASAKDSTDSTSKPFESNTQEQSDSINFESSLRAIDAKMFVLQVDKLIHAKGYTNLPSTMNFIMIRNDEAIVQLPNYKKDKNGLGKEIITLNGSIKDYTVETKKNGDRKITLQINNKEIYLTLFNKTNQAQARLDFGITVEGKIIPYALSNVVVGNYIDRRQD